MKSIQEQVFNHYRNERYPSQCPDVRMTKSSVNQRRNQDTPVCSPLVQNLLKKCKFMEDLVTKSRKIINEKEEKIQVLVSILRQREMAQQELQIQTHKLLEERQILIEHITQLEQQMNMGDEDQLVSQNSSNNLVQYQHHVTNLNDLRHFLNQIRQSQEDIPIFMDVDNLTYEQLLQLEDTIGYVNRGLTDEQIKSIPKIPFNQTSTDEHLCTICQLDFEESDQCRVLGCNHLYHSKCIKMWLKKEKHCPVCKSEILTNQLQLE